ncbi:MAG: amidohydrolase, partial [Mogibacterium sp.]|nr:amidohydrolase [Mogibacterium sp.]
MDKQRLWEIVDACNEEYEQITAEVWAHPETNYTEYESSQIQADAMEKNGFRITKPLCGVKTAFSAEYGSGKPVIAIVGYVDALPDLSQEADVFEYRPIEKGGNGHGCGHNLVGAGSMQAACSLKKYMEEHNIPGTLRYYCTPAEEGGGGKVWLCSRGAFDDIDVALIWHPDPSLFVSGQALACVTARVRFEGQGGHAGRPWEGRSALDALTLMQVGVQFLREHVIPDARISYSITNTGGAAPNVVQPEAEGSFLIRAPKQEIVFDIFERVKRIGEGAALMTDTKMLEPEIENIYSDNIVSNTVDDIVYQNILEIFPLEYTEDELEYARKFQKFGRKPNASEPMEMDTSKRHLPPAGSTDFSEISWFAPSNMCFLPCYPVGTPGHTWMYVAMGKSSIALKGMHAAAKVISATALQFLTDPELLAKAQEEQQKKMAGRTYKTL